MNRCNSVYEPEHKTMGSDGGAIGRDSQVIGKLRVLENGVVMIEDLCERIEERLNTVLTPDYPRPATAEKERDELLVPLADKLMALSSRLLSRANNLESILERIEL